MSDILKTDNIEEIIEWTGDALKRREYSVFLSNYVENRISKSGEPLTIALDGSWGSGKTFFITNWLKDIQVRNGGAIIFDAWKNDFSSEVLVSFMAELSIGMKPLQDRVSKKAQAFNLLNDQTRSLMKGFRKAALPATAVISKGLLKKFTGVAVDQIVEAINSSGSDPTDQFELAKATESAEEDFEKGLETFFEKTLKSHKARAIATSDFKAALEKLVATLQSEKAIVGPLYIFIDELDRCRPDYAIKLLEGIKHLFAVKGVVFVVSTNIGQLSKSIQAVYGSDFDGFNYLKRFFDFEFALPEADIYSYSNLLMQEFPLFEGRKLDYGINKDAVAVDNYLSLSFEFIARAFNLNLRAQRQIWLIASAAAAGIPDTKTISVMWLFFLAVLRHSFPSTLDVLSKKALSAIDFTALCETVGNFKDVQVPSIRIVTDRQGFRSSREKVLLPLLDVLFVYHCAVFQTIDQISKITSARDLNYPNSLIDLMNAERPNPYSTSTEYRPFIRNYGNLVKMAGQLTS